MKPIACLIALLLVAGCATTPKVADEPAPPPPAGMEQLLGKPAETALALLGRPRLDRREGMARQLQFASGCILDLFYYQKPGEAPLATHAEARLPDGRNYAAGDCLQMLLKARSAG
jgi:hypothetical protein